MAFKMKNPSVAKMVKMAGNNRTAMKMKAEEKAAMKMKKAAMKLKEEAAMKKAHEAAMKLKKESAMKAAKPDFPDIDGDGDTSESMKKAAADKKSAAKMKKPMKMKKESSMKMGHKSPAKLKKESPAKMGHSPKKMKKSAMKLDDKKDTRTAEKKTEDFNRKHSKRLGTTATYNPEASKKAGKNVYTADKSNQQMEAEHRARFERNVRKNDPNITDKEMDEAYKNRKRK